MLFNELIKFIWKYTQLDIYLTHLLQGKKWAIQQKFTHVETFENKVKIFYHAKVDNYILVKAFMMKLSNLCLFFFYLSNIKSLSDIFSKNDMENFMCMVSVDG
jgi:hypothetical protein